MANASEEFTPSSELNYLAESIPELIKDGVKDFTQKSFIKFSRNNLIIEQLYASGKINHAEMGDLQRSRDFIGNSPSKNIDMLAEKGIISENEKSRYSLLNSFSWLDKETPVVSAHKKLDVNTLVADNSDKPLFTYNQNKPYDPLARAAEETTNSPS